LGALDDVGFDGTKVEVHAEPVPLVGYEGGRRTQTANIVIRRQNVGHSSNDLGFLDTETGYRAIVSDYDQARFGAGWLAQLNTRYQSRWSAKQERLAEQQRLAVEQERQRLVEAQRQAIYQKAKQLGYRVQETQEGDKLRLVLVKRVY
jgi:hypothetical protein